MASVIKIVCAVSAAIISVGSIGQPDQQEVVALRLTHRNEILKGQRPRLLQHGPTSSRRIALTFDDGPHPEFTPVVLKILKQHHAGATFFMIGAKVAVDGETARMVRDAGFEIGNHTQMHKNLTTLSDSAVENEWAEGSNTLRRVLGIEPTFGRPPGGHFNDKVVGQAVGEGLTTVLWTDNVADYAQSTSTNIAKEVLKRAHPGGIILLHDTVDITIKSLPTILEGLQKRGYKVVSVGELMKP